MCQFTRMEGNNELVVNVKVLDNYAVNLSTIVAGLEKVILN